MPDAEVMNIYIECLANSAGWTRDIMALIFAFLIGTHFVASTLDKINSSVVVTIYSFFYLQMVMGAHNGMVLSSSFGLEVIRRANIPDAELAMIKLPAIANPELIMLMPGIYSMVFVAAWLASLFYFFYSRKHEIHTPLKSIISASDQ